jgi:hypothetical protein
MNDKMNSKEAASAGEAEGCPSRSSHPSRSLAPRARGYGIGGGYEKAYRKRSRPEDRRSASYGPVPHSGYYGAGAGAERFERGQAGYNTELPWYAAQYGESTSGLSKEKV